MNARKVRARERTTTGVARAGRMAAAVLLATAAGIWAQEALKATLHPSGLIQVSRAGVALATIELSAHGSGWEHAPQKTASAETSDLPGAAGKRITGVLTIPKTAGATLRYSESVKALPQGFELTYDLSSTAATKLSGLQFSVNLPVTQYAGKEVLISRLGDEPDLVGLPQEQQKGTFQLWSGQGARVEVAKGTADAVTIELRAATDVVVQDLRQWNNPVFEVRVPAIMEDPGRDVAAGEAFHLDLRVTFAAPVTLAGP
jgi:hypothetical protein